MWSCQYTLEDVYAELDSLRKPYSENLSYKLTDADYNTIANFAKQMKTHEDSIAAKEISSYKSFSETRPVQRYAPPFLLNTFKALDSGSIVALTYKYDNKFNLNVITIKDTIVYATTPSSSLNKRMIDTCKKYYPNPNENTRVAIKYTAKLSETDFSEAYFFYIYNGGVWERPSNTYELIKTDYQAMGGSVAQYMNFSSSASPDFYLPIYLKIKFPYQAPNTSLYVVYKYYVNATTTNITVDKFLYDGISWTNAEYKTDQFIHVGNKTWIFDPTVYITLKGPDYQVVVDWVYSQDSIKAYVDSYKTTEYYFGFSGYYQNIDMRLSKRRSVDPNGYLTGLTDEQAMNLLWERVKQGLIKYLEIKFPNQQPTVSGVQVYYVLTVATYEPERHKYRYKFKVTDVGKYQYVEGPIKIE